LISTLEDFKIQLYKLFQSNCSDLNFGIYRFMNYKQNIIYKFIMNDLSKIIIEKLKNINSQAYKDFEPVIFNHIYSFFSYYYQNGNLVSKHRYFIPYNNKDVYLYWINNDQYYVKTIENFTDYNFILHGVNIIFKVINVNFEQNSIKNKKCFLIPKINEIIWDVATNSVTIPFEYRTLSEQEKTIWGKKNQQKVIIIKATKSILEYLESMGVISIDNKSITFLEYHLRKYIRKNKNMHDVFIHKDLKGFLSHEFDFYLKNEILNLGDIDNIDKSNLEKYLQIVQIIKSICDYIIDFLDRIESFQRILWEKRKFITDVQYCITVGNIDESLYSDIANCDAQWDEWKELFHLDEEQPSLYNLSKEKKEKRIAFIKDHPTLVLDTKYFNTDFVDKLLASIVNLDDKINGLLIHSENWQALNFLLEKYHKKVQTIYIDPPFNTGNDFIFIDNFQDSSWLALMENRLRLAKDLLSEEGNFYMHLDHNVEHYGRILLDNIFKEENFKAKITWNTGENISGFKSQALNWIRQADFIHYYTKTDKNIFQKAYEIIGEGKNDIGWLDILGKNKNELYIEKWENGKFVQKRVNFKVKAKGTIWNDIYSFQYSEPRITESLSFASNQKPENLLRRIIQTSSNPEGLVLDYFVGSGTTCAVAQKLNRRWVGIEMGDHFNEIYLDVVNIKKKAEQEENGESEEEIIDKDNPSIVEVLSETKSEKIVLMKKIGALGRLKIVLGGDKEFKAIHSPVIRKPHLTKDVNWQGGGFFKYMRLESYEDALNNIEFDKISKQQMFSFDNYLLKYIFKQEIQKDEMILNVDKFTKPFSYKLYIRSNNQTYQKLVNIPETFNYLIGLNVNTRKVYYDQKRKYLIYQGHIDDRNITVIWRETDGWTKEDLERDKKFITGLKLLEESDEIFVNGDSLIPNAKTLELEFITRMFAPVESN